MDTTTHDWYTILTANSARWPLTVHVPAGPWHGRERAEAALEHWERRAGDQAGSAVSAMSIRIAGPFCSRSIARRADISDYPEQLCHHRA